MKKLNRQQRRRQTHLSQKRDRDCSQKNQQRSRLQNGSTRAQHEPSQSHEQRAVELFEKFDNFSNFRNGLRKIAADKGEWAGIPMPLEGVPLIVEKSYPFAHVFNKTGEDSEEPGIKIRNVWWSARLHAEIYIYEEDGKLQHIVFRKPPHNFSRELIGFGCMDVWGLEQEQNALKLLATLVRHRQLKQYILTGGFLETSKRSGLTYYFRRLRPTVVLDARMDNPDQPTRVICTLCMHPIAYYEGTWAGAMVPTDDVIAALMLMRGDEHMYWRRANQHSPERPEAGL